VDVLVEVDPSIGLRFVELADDLERALGRHVDVVSRRAIKPSLKLPAGQGVLRSGGDNRTHFVSEGRLREFAKHQPETGKSGFGNAKRMYAYK
jgi:hypothetical protein